MLLNTLDWGFIIGFFILSFSIGAFVSKRAGANSSEYFLSGRNMPWWLLGVSMVATTFATDTPNLITDIVRQNGVSGNWVWWAFLLTGMLTVFVYARLWRRSGVITDVEFYELRYSGRTSAFLRGFRALYLGVIFNGIIMASVTLAAIKIAGVLLNLPPYYTVLIAVTVTVSYSMLGGLRGVLITDLIQFGLAMGGAIVAAIVSLQHASIGSLENLLTHVDVADKLNFIPDFNNTDIFVSIFVIPLAVQWWSVWYPGAEPGGGGYLAQRMLAAKNEKHALSATLLFNIAHYAMRPWPWIIVALCSVVVFPDLESLRNAFPGLNAGIVKHDLAYPAMLTFLPNGLLGLVITSLIAAYMSTISTQLNWGSSYIVNDFYKRFIRPEANEKQLVFVGRTVTLILMVIACVLAPLLENAKRAFDLLLQIGAGTGLLFILRWFWWRINAFSEIVAMTVSFLIACYFEFIHSHTGLPEFQQWQKLITGVGITTFAWLAATFLARGTSDKVLFNFYRTIRPGGPGWKRILTRAKKAGYSLGPAEEKWDMQYGILCMVFGCVLVYAALFAVGAWLYHRHTQCIVLIAAAIVAAIYMVKFWKNLKLT